MFRASDAAMASAFRNFSGDPPPSFQQIPAASLRHTWMMKD
jgi:hypothetical protein